MEPPHWSSLLVQLSDEALPSPKPGDPRPGKAAGSASEALPHAESPRPAPHRPESPATRHFPDLASETTRTAARNLAAPGCSPSLASGSTSPAAVPASRSVGRTAADESQGRGGSAAATAPSHRASASPPPQTARHWRGPELLSAAGCQCCWHRPSEEAALAAVRSLRGRHGWRAAGAASRTGKKSLGCASDDCIECLAGFSASGTRQDTIVGIDDSRLRTGCLPLQIRPDRRTVINRCAFRETAATICSRQPPSRHRVMLASRPHPGKNCQRPI